jgi:predicted GNAT superfamily acetyltransferase
MAPDDNPAVSAGEAADAAAGRLGLRIVDLTTVAEQKAAADLFCRIWRAASPDQLINASMMRALAHSGNYVVGAYRGGRLLGAAVAFLGHDHLHSHITGVDPAGQSAGVGYAIKLHQRAWTLRRGIPEVRWTFDPLVRRNAYFNLHKLGARAAAYLPDFYGEMDDGINTGDATDRLYIRWELASAAVAAAVRGQAPDRRPTAAVLLDRSAAEAPVEPAAPPALDGEAVLVAVPSDVEALRRRDPQLARQWRYAVREAMGHALDRGYRITGFGDDGRYLMEESP